MSLLSKETKVETAIKAYKHLRLANYQQKNLLKALADVPETRYRRKYCTLVRDPKVNAQVRQFNAKSAFEALYDKLSAIEKAKFAEAVENVSIGSIIREQNHAK